MIHNDSLMSSFYTDIRLQFKVCISTGVTNMELHESMAKTSVYIILL